MMDPAGAVLAAAIAGTAVQVMRLTRRWSAGRAVAVDWVRGLRRLPHAYLHTVHEVVARDPYASRMHQLAAGGLVAALALSVLLHVFRVGGAVAGAAILLAVVASAAGTGMAAWRRRPPRPPRLTGRKFDALPGVLGGTLLFLAMAAMASLSMPSGAAGGLRWVWPAIALFGAVPLGVLVAWSAAGPMRHAVAGVVNLLAHSRPARFDGAIASDLQPLALAAEAVPPRLGVGDITEFGWNRLAQFDACVQCGRCQDACPAFAAGQPLNPKAFIQSLVGAITSANSSEGVPLVGSLEAPGAIRPSTLWACTTCRACVYECPMLIEHVDAIVDLRRHEVLERGAAPANTVRALTELRATDTVSGKALDARLDWAADLALPLMADRHRAEILLWIGEGGFDRRNQRSLRALVALLRYAGVDFAVLGPEELDCGDLARRLGDELTFQDLARRNIITLQRYTFDTILTMDPHAFHVLRNEYPAFGGRYRVVHHAAFLDGLIAAGQLRLSAAGAAEPVTYHDPCYLSRYNGEVDGARRLLARLGRPIVEMQRARMRSQCCGWGGGAALADVPGTRRIPDLRMDQARATGAPVVASACPNCAIMLEGVTGARPAVADLAELVLEAVERSPAHDQVPT
jgi:Fe-S oxidoreductase